MPNARVVEAMVYGIGESPFAGWQAWLSVSSTATGGKGCKIRLMTWRAHGPPFAPHHYPIEELIIT